MSTNGESNCQPESIGINSTSIEQLEVESVNPRCFFIRSVSISKSESEYISPDCSGELKAYSPGKDEPTEIYSVSSSGSNERIAELLSDLELSEILNRTSISLTSTLPEYEPLIVEPDEPSSLHETLTLDTSDEKSFTIEDGIVLIPSESDDESVRKPIIMKEPSKEPYEEYDGDYYGEPEAEPEVPSWHQIMLKRGKKTMILYGEDSFILPCYRNKVTEEGLCRYFDYSLAFKEKLLWLYRENYQGFKAGHDDEKTWKLIAEQYRKRRYGKVTWNDCETLFLQLLTFYEYHLRRIQFNHIANINLYWPFFERFHEILNIGHFCDQHRLRQALLGFTLQTPTEFKAWVKFLIGRQHLFPRHRDKAWNMVLDYIRDCDLVPAELEQDLSKKILIDILIGAKDRYLTAIYCPEGKDNHYLPGLDSYMRKLQFSTILGFTGDDEKFFQHSRKLSKRRTGKKTRGSSSKSHH